MHVTFTRTGERRYAVAVVRPGAPRLIMDPAGGYDPLVPHDLAHFAWPEPPPSELTRSHATRSRRRVARPQRRATS